MNGKSAEFAIPIRHLRTCSFTQVALPHSVSHLNPVPANV